MVWPFNRKLSDKDAAVATQVVRHLQTQSALQQLATEIYGAGMSMAAGSVNTSGSVLVRDIASIVDPALMQKFLVPATEQKIDIIVKMDEEHRDFLEVQKPDKSQDAYDKWTDFLPIYLARAQLQLACWNDYVDDPSRDLTERLASLDRAEDASLTVAVTALNTLIKRAGLEGEPWLSITCAAFNDVRNRVGQSPLAESEFQERFNRGIAGEPVKFFD